MRRVGLILIPVVLLALAGGLWSLVIGMEEEIRRLDVQLEEAEKARKESDRAVIEAQAETDRIESDSETVAAHLREANRVVAHERDLASRKAETAEARARDLERQLAEAIQPSDVHDPEVYTEIDTESEQPLETCLELVGVQKEQIGGLERVNRANETIIRNQAEEIDLFAAQRAAWRRERVNWLSYRATSERERELAEKQIAALKKHHRWSKWLPVFGAGAGVTYDVATGRWAAGPTVSLVWRF